MGVLFRRSLSIVPDLPAEPRRLRGDTAFGVRTFHTPEGRAAALKIAAGSAGHSWTRVFPYLPPELFEPGPAFRPQAPLGVVRTLAISLLTFAVVGGVAAWLIG